VAQRLAVQREAAEEEDEPAQRLAVQREAAEEEDEPAQRLVVQREAAEEEDEPAQRLAVQREATEEEEEPAQTLAIQRQAMDEEEEPAQTLAVQRQPVEDEEEEPAQTLSVQRQADEEEERPVQTHKNGFGGPSMSAAAGQAIHSRGAGVPLAPATRVIMERSLGVDLGDVRVHAGSGAHVAARALRARAFTHRNHIWLGPGESQANLRLMAHETAHVLQQDGIVRRKPADEELAPADQAAAARPPTPLGAPPALSANGSQPRPQPARDESADRQETPEAVRAATTGDLGAPAPVTGEEAPLEAAPEPAAAAPAAEGQQPAAAGKQPAQPPAGPGGEEEQAPQRSPATPEEDPAFQQTLGKIRKTKKAQSKHAAGSDKQGEVKAAAVLPEAEQETRNARSDHLTAMDSMAQETEKKEESKPSFTPESFKALLKSNLTELEQKLPHSESEAKEFKREKPLEAVKQNIGGQVATENAKVTGPMASQVKQDAPKSEQKVETPAGLNEESAGDEPKPISATAAAPKPMLDSEVSLEPESRSLDDKMAEEGITEEQLAASNEPTFVEALDSKRQAQQEAAAAPGRYREKEEKVLANAQGRAGSAGQAGFGAMFAGRTQAFGDVYAKQSGTESSDKSAQTAVLRELNRIYSATKTDVEKILGDLSTAVDDLFELEANAAKATFEKQVEDQLDDIYGLTVIDDWLFGEDTAAIEEVFRVEKERFLTAMDLTLDSIAELIARQLNAAIDRIKQGRQETKDFYDGLSKEQQRLADEAIAFFDAQYDTLEDSVNQKQEELAQALAESYKSNVDALRESFDKIKEEVSKGWIGKAIDFIVDVATAIKKLGELLLSIISRLAGLIGDILAHPIRFLENLAAGVAAGFAKFASNLDTYLLGGFFDWLRGSVGGAPIQLPTSFEPQGLFGLATQLLAIDYAMFRKLAARKLGESVVALLEQGSELVGPGLEVFRLVRTEGLGALWNHISAMVSGNITQIFDQIKETVLYQTIEKVLTFIAGLFTPAGAFIKAIQLLYRGLRFLIDNIDRIAELVNAFLDSLALAVTGNVGGIAEKVVLALRNVVVIVIDFLAKLVGLGSLGDKVRRILKALRKPVVRAMSWFLDKIKALLRRLLGKGAGRGKGGKKLPTKDSKVREARKQQAISQVRAAMERGIPRTDLVRLLKRLKRNLSLQRAHLDENDDVTIENSRAVKIQGVSYDLRVTKVKTAKGKRTKSERGAIKLGTFSAHGKTLPTPRGVLEKFLAFWPYPDMPSSAFRPEKARGAFTGKVDAIDRIADETSMLYTAEYGNVESRLRDRYFTFDSGHLIANEFGGRESEENIVPMKPAFNQNTGAFRKLEYWVRSLLPDSDPTKQTVAVTMAVTPKYPGPVKETLSVLATRINSRLKAIGFQKEATESQGGTFRNRRNVLLDNNVRSKRGQADAIAVVPARIPVSFAVDVGFTALVDPQGQLDPAEQARIDEIAAGTGMAAGAKGTAARIIVLEKGKPRKKLAAKSAGQMRRVKAKQTFKFPHYNP
jgi:hypothetical protein